jgi:hypothetical protein
MTNEEILKVFNEKAYPKTIHIMINECTSDPKNWKDGREYMMDEYEFDPEEFLTLVPDFKVVKTGRDTLDPDGTQIVLYFEANDLYLAVDGCYSSYDSDDYSEETWFIAKREIVEIEKFTEK